MYETSPASALLLSAMGFLSRKRSADEAHSSEAEIFKAKADAHQGQAAAGAGAVGSTPPPGVTVSEVAATSTEPMNDILLQVPAAEVHRVRA